MKRVKIGIIGTGAISHLHMTGYNNLDNAEVIAVCDINRQRAADYAARYGIPHVFTDYNEMLRIKELDAVSVVTWNNDHTPVSVAALHAGKHVLCEKPLAVNAAQAGEIENAAKASGKLLMVGFVRRFGKNTKIVSDFIRQGTIGEILYAKTSFIRRCGNPCGWFSDKARSGGGPLIDLGVHMIDLIRFLTGKPKAVSVSGATFSKLGPRHNIKMINRYKTVDHDSFCNVEDMAVAMMRFDNGMVLNVETSFSQHIKDPEVRLELYGSKAGIVMEPKLEIFSEANGYLVDVTPRYDEDADPFTENFKSEIAHFIDCIVNGTECLNPVGDGVELAKIVDAVYRSAEIGQEVKIDND